MRNTKKSGIIRFFIYKEGKKYIGVCLDLDIVEENRNIEQLKESLTEAARGHIMTVAREKMDDKFLNRRAPRSYWKKYQTYLKYLEQERVSGKACHYLNGATISSACLPLHRNWVMM